MLIVIGGATGTGKSAAAIALACAARDRGIAVDVVNADALQLYRGMDIGTAKVPVEEREGVAHHLLDVLGVHERASVAAYQRTARCLLQNLADSGRHTILVGGTGLYIESVIRLLDFPGTDAEVRAGLQREMAQVGVAAMRERLERVDPDAADRIGGGDARRLLRALEVMEITGRPFSSFGGRAGERWRPYRLLVLDTPRDELAARLRVRSERMWNGGLLEETRGLLREGLAEGPTASKAIGYAQALAVLGGKMTRVEALADTVAQTIRYAKRQRTWFRRYPEASWIDASAYRAEEWLADLVA